MNNCLMLGFFSDTWGEMINTLRSIRPDIKIWIILGAILLAVFCVIKLFKVNYNAKNEKKRNFFWIFPIIILILFIWMLGL